MKFDIQEETLDTIFLALQGMASAANNAAVRLRQQIGGGNANVQSGADVGATSTDAKRGPENLDPSPASASPNGPRPHARDGSFTILESPGFRQSFADE
jgi:hypothetical protein